MMLPLSLVLSLAASASATSGSTSPDSADTSLDALASLPSTAVPYGPLQTSPRYVPPPANRQGEWRVGQPLMQGFFGVSFYNDVSREGGSVPDVEGTSGGLDELPLIGGGGQWKLGGKGVDFGIEGLFSFEWRGNASAVVVGGGGAAVAVDVDLMVIDVYGGPFVSKFLGDGDKVRIYAGAGPLFQFADYDQETNVSHDSGSGFGFGGYVRTGIEFVLPSRTMIGVGGLWSDSKVDLDGGLGDLNIQGYQLLFTVSRGI